MEDDLEIMAQVRRREAGTMRTHAGHARPQESMMTPT
jgi:hypothetical protein